MPTPERRAYNIRQKLKHKEKVSEKDRAWLAEYVAAVERRRKKKARAYKIAREAMDHENPPTANDPPAVPIATAATGGQPQEPPQEQAPVAAVTPPQPSDPGPEDDTDPEEHLPPIAVPEGEEEEEEKKEPTPDGPRLQLDLNVDLARETTELMREHNAELRDAGRWCLPEAYFDHIMLPSLRFLEEMAAHEAEKKLGKLELPDQMGIALGATLGPVAGIEIQRWRLHRDQRKQAKAHPPRPQAVPNETAPSPATVGTPTNPIPTTVERKPPEPEPERAAPRAMTIRERPAGSGRWRR